MSLPGYFILIALAVATVFPARCSYAVEDPAKAKQELERIQKELKGVQKKTKETEKKERSVLGDLDKIDRSLAKKRAELKEAQKRLERVSGDINSTEVDIRETRRMLDRKKSDLTERLTALYKTGKAGGNWVVLLAGDSGSILKRYKYLSVMSERDRRLMDGYSRELDTLTSQRDRLDQQKHSYESLKKKRDAEAHKVAAEEEGKKKMLASIRKEKKSYIAMQKELVDAGERMKALMKKLEAAAKAKPTPSNLTGTLKTGLDWPATGKVVSKFGKQKHPEYDTYIYKKGIEIAADIGSDVRAVDVAEVVFADWFRGLGLVAILRHAGDYYSVYAHLSGLKVKEGDKVAKGQVIALVGDSGTPAGPSLYFEIRKGSEAIDPVAWLKKR